MQIHPKLSWRYLGYLLKLSSYSVFNKVHHLFGISLIENLMNPFCTRHLIDLMAIPGRRLSDATYTTICYDQFSHKTITYTNSAAFHSSTSCFDLKKAYANLKTLSNGILFTLSKCVRGIASTI